MISLTKQSTLGYLKRVLKFLENYYPIIIGIILFLKTIHIYMINAGPGYKLIVSIYWLIFLTAYKDLRKDVRWIPFIIACIPLFLFLSYLTKNGYSIWGKMLAFERKLHIVIDLNPIFKEIPLNNGSFARIYKSDNLTWFMRLVYNNGFLFPPLICFYRSAIEKDLKKMLKYVCSAHVFQIFIISPFYITFHLQEVWFVLGQPDGLARHFKSLNEAAGTALNCFPSMHTSIAFAAFLLVLREKSKIFKFVWGFFCLSVIYSTLYLEIHWVIDIFGGLLLGFCAVKLADFAIDNLQKKLQPLLDKYYYKGKNDFFAVESSISTEN